MFTKTEMIISVLLDLGISWSMAIGILCGLAFLVGVHV